MGSVDFFPEQVMRAEVARPLAANMNAAFKKVRGTIGGSVDHALRDLIVERIVALASGRTRSRSR
jgi:hypothetical protein